MFALDGFIEVYSPGGHVALHGRTSWQDLPLTNGLTSSKPSFLPEVQPTSDTPDRPSFGALKKLPFFPNENGVYADMLETASDNYIYPDAAPHQTSKARRANHDTPSALMQHPQSTYYGIRHSTTTLCQSRCITLVRIPIPPNLDPEEKALRRLLCRLAMFAYWLCAFKSTGRGSELAAVAAKMSKEIYGNSRPEWEGTMPHSSLTEQLGTEEFGKVRQNRFQEVMLEYNNLYGQDVPDEIVALAWNRARFDTLQQREDRARRNDALPAAQIAADKEKNNADQKMTRASWTVTRKEENQAYMAMYHENRMNAMTEKERDEHREGDRRVQARSGGIRQLSRYKKAQ